VGGVLVVCTETTAQVLGRQRESDRAAARTAERDRLARMFEQAPSFMALLVGPEHRFDLANQAYLRLIGRHDIVGRTLAEALPDAVEQGYLALLDDVFRSGEPFRSVGAKFAVQPTPGGPVHERFVDFIYQPLKNENGEVTGIFVEGADVTDRTLAETALRSLNETLEQRVASEVAARSKTEEVLLQAQKMEAVGQLTGGIAHDFNNMLQGITGGIALARQRLTEPRDERVLRFLDLANSAAERAAALTRRLLAFGRRQPLDPKSVELDDLIRGMEELIQRTVGPGVRLDLELRDGCWPVRCDPHQLESALLNLAINARDAMLPDGGRLLIETAHVRISVSDTGTGMTPDVQAHAFEPFFTTKPDGQGTGLGLSQLYGFIRQSNGILRLDSVVGVGTSLHVFLPRSQGAKIANADAPQAEATLPAVSGKIATVLLVDDEITVRASAAEALRQKGLIVVEAGDGPTGLNALRTALSHKQFGTLDLLVTDVGLPGGLNGRQLADAARELVPGLPILLITGYAGDAIEGRGQLDVGMEILIKPFQLDAFAERVQAMIGAAMSA
jgi:signal transduction histidine kinase/ActR/RegA family two-component response regulator